MQRLPEDRPTLRFPAALLELAAGLEQRAGAPLFAVGGTVRDALLGLDVDDWDLATAAPSGLVAALFDEVAPAAPVVEEDHSLGTVGRRIEGIAAVVSTFRVESDYGPDRRPRTLRFATDPQQDAARRDFTINAVYLPVLQGGGGLIDPVGGIEDLRRGILRVVGDPVARLGEDPVRILRGARFVARLALSLSADTEAAFRVAGPSVAELSSYRLRTELERLFAGPWPRRGLQLLARAAVLSRAVPEVVGAASGRESTGLRTGAVLAGGLLPELAWPLWIHGGVVPAPQVVGADDPSASIRLEELLQRLDCSTGVRERARAVSVVLQELGRVGADALAAVPERVSRHWPSLSGLASPLAAALQESPLLGVWQAWADRCAAAAARDREVEALLGGADLRDLGLAPGPVLGRLLRTVRERLRSEAVTSRDTALAIARAEVERHLAE